MARWPRTAHGLFLSRSWYRGALEPFPTGVRTGDRAISRGGIGLRVISERLRAQSKPLAWRADGSRSMSSYWLHRIRFRRAAMPTTTTWSSRRRAGTAHPRYTACLLALPARSWPPATLKSSCASGVFGPCPARAGARRIVQVGLPAAGYRIADPTAPAIESRLDHKQALSWREYAGRVHFDRLLLRATSGLNREAGTGDAGYIILT